MGYDYLKFYQLCLQFSVLIFLLPLSISPIQSEVFISIEKCRAEKEKKSFLNLTLNLKKFISKNTQEIQSPYYKIKFFYLHWKTFPRTRGRDGRTRGINHLLLTDPIERVLLYSRRKRKASEILRSAAISESRKVLCDHLPQKTRGRDKRTGEKYIIFCWQIPLKGFCCISGGGEIYHKSSDKLAYLRTEDGFYVTIFPKPSQVEPGIVDLLWRADFSDIAW